MTKTKRKFTKEFREEAVKMVLQDGLSQSEVGRRLDIGTSLISGWIQATKKDGPEAFRGHGNLTAQAAEVKKLQQENKELKDKIAFLKKSALYFASTEKVRFATINEHRGQYSLKAMCKAMKVSPSGYHSWKKREPSTRDANKYRLIRLIEKVHAGSRNNYGSPRVHAMLNSLGESISKTRVARLMQQFGIRAKTKRKFKATTNSNHKLPVAANILARNFTSKAANKAWAGDITYL